jgi:hypothetical protein
MLSFICLSATVAKIIKSDYGFNQGFVLLDHQFIIEDSEVKMKSDLSLQEQIEEKIKMSNKMFGIINGDLTDPDNTSLILLSKFMVRSHLEYVVLIKKINKRY